MQKTNGRTIIIDTVDGLKEVLVAGGKCIYMASGVRGPRGPRGVPGQPGAAGNGIVSIVLLSAVGLNKTYRITFTNGTHFDYVVTDGEDGAPGEPGEPGKAATIAVGTVTTLPAGSSATVTNVGTESAAVLDFGIPEGEQGDPGASEWGSITGTLSDQTDLQSAIDSKADIITRSVSGDLVHIEDGAPRNVSALSVGIEPVQDLHGQASPYPAGGGKNLLNPEGVSQINSTAVNIRWGVEFTEPGTYTVKAHGTSYTGSTSIYVRKYSGGTYGAYTALVSSGSTQNVAFTETIASGDKIIVFDPNEVSEATAITDFTQAKIQCESGSSATSYAPYSNICPITGWSQAVVTRTGKNLLPTLTGANNNGLTSTVNADGSITISGRATGTGGYVTALTMFNRIKAGTTVTIGFGISMPQRMRCFFKNAAGSANNVTWDVNSTKSSYSNTLAKDIYGLLLYFSTTANTDYNFTIYPQLELGSTATTYESYQGQQVTIALGSTVYGGTLDVLTGTLTVTKGIIDLGGLTWDKSSSNPSVFNSTGLTDHALTTGINVICSQYPAVQANQYSISTMPDKCVKTNASYAQYIYIKNTAYESYTKEQFKTAMSGVQLVYELATPIVITGLTPAQMSTLLGVNNIWADTGATSLTYRADTKMYIDEQVSAEAKAVRSILTSVEAEMKATKNYTAGQVLIVGDDLYKATANIANGATLTVGTNVTKVTMAEWILSLV